MNILIIISLLILTIALVKGYECFKRTLRYIRILKWKKALAKKDVFVDVKSDFFPPEIPNCRCYVANVDEAIKGLENLGKALKEKEWNSFTGYRSEKDIINETLDRR